MKKRKPIEEMGFWKVIISIEEYILVITSFTAACLIAIGVFTRYVLGVDFFGQEEIITLIAMWLYWIGGVYGSYEGSHIKGDILNTYVKNEKIKKALNTFVYVVSIAIAGTFTVWSYGYLMRNIAQWPVSIGLKIPLVICQIPLLIGFAMMTLYELYHLIKLLSSKESDDTVAGGTAEEGI